MNIFGFEISIIHMAEIVVFIAIILFALFLFYRMGLIGGEE